MQGSVSTLDEKASDGTDKLTRGRELALLDGDCSALYVDANTHSVRVLRSKDA